MDKLLAMRTFLTILERGSLTAAAAVLDTSLPTVVRTLSALESELGVRLLNRTTRRLALTDEGREYSERCRRILADIEDAQNALSKRRSVPSGRVVVTAPATFGRRHVTPLLCEYLAAQPQVTAELLLLDRVVHLMDEGIDVAVRIGQLEDSALIVQHVGHVRWVVCASPKYLARRGVPAHPSELAEHACLRFVEAGVWTTWRFVLEGKVRRVDVRGALDTNHVEAALDACVAGFGIGRFLDYQVADELAAGRLRLLLSGYALPQVPVQVVFAHARGLSARVRSLVDQLVPGLQRRLAELPRLQPKAAGKRTPR
ncbi:MAG: LysR family transcriptional regulator [Polyangiales bacterium]